MANDTGLVQIGEEDGVREYRIEQEPRISLLVYFGEHTIGVQVARDDIPIAGLPMLDIETLRAGLIARLLTTDQGMPSTDARIRTRVESALDDVGIVEVLDAAIVEGIAHAFGRRPGGAP